MTRPSLSEILEALLGSVVDTGERIDPRSGVRISISEADITLPLEASIGRGSEGEPTILAAPPFGTMKTGFDLPVHYAHIHLVAEGDG